ncbi:DUF4861 domain-containing protein [Flexithrix dorotheae]|uniref:DUF4861 domain-containing protein n=1 Tax=Flexithrix dorotheae TaxID=70993 RepID=UPI000367AEC2|nr:DUF4861 domain-containing protein [Flexithrix dorotheae]
MSKNNLLISLITLIATGIVACSGQKSSDNESSSTAIIEVKNNLGIDRKDEHLIFNKQDIIKYAGEIPEGQFPKISKSDGQQVVSQYDDLDGDGEWDELAILVDLKAKTSEKLNISFVPENELSTFPKRANIHFGKKLDGDTTYTSLTQETRPRDHFKGKETAKYQMEGPAWENDIVAFRLYFDPRNGKDIFGKRTNEMVLEQVGIEGENYHKLADWGMDVLKVGNSLGAGALALKDGDNLVRLTGCEDAYFHLISEGPVRAILDFDYKKWPVGNQTYDLKERITIWAGKYGYESSVTIQGLPAGKELVTGIVNLQSDSVYFDNETPGFISLATHDNQAYDEEKMGMAIIAAKSDFISHEMAPEEGEGITQTFYVRLKATDNTPTKFHFLVGWEIQDAKFAEKDYFLQVINTEKEKLNSPLEVTQAM